MGYKMKGWKAYDKLSSNKKPDGKAGSSAFQKADGKIDYEPQTQYRGYKGSEHTDLTPQTQRNKMKNYELEGHIEGKFDNEYKEAQDSGDKGRIKRQEGQMLKYKKELESRGEKYDHVNMKNFGKKKK